VIPCWIKWEISLGELVLALATLGAAWYVGSALKRKQDRDIAVRDLVRFFCRESLQLLAVVSDTFADESARTNGRFDAVGKNNIRMALQRLSNSLHTINVSVGRGGLKESERLGKPGGQLRTLLDAHDYLRIAILDPLADPNAVQITNGRQVEGAIRQVREAIVGLELDIVSRLE